MSVEYNVDEISHCEGYKNEGMGSNESVVQAYDPGSSDIGSFYSEI